MELKSDGDAADMPMTPPAWWKTASIDIAKGMDNIQHEMEERLNEIDMKVFAKFGDIQESQMLLGSRLLALESSGKDDSKPNSQRSSESNINAWTAMLSPHSHSRHTMDKNRLKR